MVLMAKTNLDIEERLFGCGADDVVAGRQTSASVLTKRIQAHLRYNRLSWPRSNVVELRDTVVDLARRQVQRNGSIRRLPGMLTDLLKYFLDNPDRVISRQELAKSSLWADSICTPPEEGGRAMDVSIGKLRRIIEHDPRRPQIITAVRGIGWKLGKDHVRRS
jgi:DNA-binding response OmpR family regulator